MKMIKAGEAAAARRRMVFDCRDAADGITPELAEAGGQPQISIDHAAFTNTGIGTLISIGNGRYYAIIATDQLDVGVEINGRYKSAATAETPAEDPVLVVNFDPVELPTSIDAELTNEHGEGDWTGDVVSGTAPGSAIIAIETTVSAYVATNFAQAFEILSYDPTDWTQIEFIIKSNIETDSDDAAMIKLIVLAGAGDEGLMILNGVESPDAGLGELTVVDNVANQLSLTVDIAAAGFDFRPSPTSEPYTYEIVVFKGAEKNILGHGAFNALRPARRSPVAD